MGDGVKGSASSLGGGGGGCMLRLEEGAASALRGEGTTGSADGRAVVVLRASPCQAVAVVSLFADEETEKQRVTAEVTWSVKILGGDGV